MIVFILKQFVHIKLENVCYFNKKIIALTWYYENIVFTSFSPSDTKFVTCSDDGTLRIWDFLRYQEERVLRGKFK